MFRILLDIIMIILLITLMGYYIIDSIVHEILGIGLFLLFSIHHLINVKWYKTIWKGRYMRQRIFPITINFLLFVSMLGMMISSIMIGTGIFGFINVAATMLGRKLHMLFNSWLFVLVSLHIGLHLKGFFLKINNKMKNSAFEYVYYLFVVLLVCFGIYAFICNGLWKDMFLLNEYKYFNYDKHYLVFYLEYLSIMFSLSIITNNIFILVRKIKWKD